MQTLKQDSLTHKALKPETGNTADKVSYVYSDRFKTAVLSIHLTVPQNKLTQEMFIQLGLNMLQGTTAHPSIASLERARADLYGTKLNINFRDSFGARTITFTCTFPEDRYITGEDKLLEKVADHLAEIVYTPLLSSEIFNRVKRERILRLLGELNNPQAVAFRDYYELIYKDEPFFTPVSSLLKDARRLSRKNLLNYYGEFISSAKIELFYCGSSTKERVENTAVRLLEKQAIKNYSRVMPHMEQSTLMLTFRFNKFAAPLLAFTAFDMLFGQMPASKLFKSLRERQNLCYSVASNIDIINGVFLIVCGIDADKRDAAKTEILAQLEAVKRGELEELDAAKLTLKVQTKIVTDSIMSLEQFRFYWDKMGFNGSPDELADEIDAVKPEDIIKAASVMRLEGECWLEGAKSVNLNNGGQERGNS